LKVTPAVWSQYARRDETRREHLQERLERAAAVERWLREEVVPGHQEYLADPTKGVPANPVLKRIKPRRGARKPE
jgi:antitoxin ParD1/3/4